MQVFAVGAEQASALMEAEIGHLAQPRQKEARKVLRIFHDRHIAIPVHVAASLAQGFSVEIPDFANRLRLAIYRRLLSAIDATTAMKQDPRQLDILPRHLLYDYCLQPLMMRIASRMEHNYLFSLDPDLAWIREDAYKSYSEEFEALLWEGLESGESRLDGSELADGWDLFWRRCSHRLWSEIQAKRHAHNGRRLGKGALLPRVMQDDVLLRMIYQLEPDARLKRDSSRKSLDISEQQNPLFSHPKQGGVVGIHATSRLEDLEDMLISELQLPPQLLADRLLNSSFFAKHRPPPLEERQQLMVLGASLDDGDHAPIALAKVAWLEAVFRIAIVLYRSELLGSDIRFGQWKSGVGLARSGMQVGDFSYLGHMDPHNVSRAQTHRFFCDAGWLPGFLDLMPALEPAYKKSITEKLQGVGEALRLQSIIDELFPEADEPTQDRQRDFSAALLVVIRKVRLGQPMPDLAGHEWVVPIHTLTIDCPETLKAGNSFVLRDDRGQTASVMIAGEAGNPVSEDTLNALLSDLVARIFDFYWERANG